MHPSFDEIRGARRTDEAALICLMAEHIEYERSTVDIAEHQDAAIAALLSATHPARCIVAVRNDEPIGYATTSPEFSTWKGCDYLHMDTLYVSEASRSGGVGAALFAAVVADAQRRGYTEVQWQTPDWNTDAIRFYERIHATAQPKMRFSIAVEVDELPQ
jgi:GNAT superfamily N-acetyltransferase